MPILDKLGIPLLVGSLLVGSSILLFKFGESQGSAAVQKKWDQAESLRAKEISRLQGQLALKESQHKEQMENITYELEQNRQRFEIQRTADELVYTARLQQSEMRANVYQRQSRGSASERDRLAEHAAQLDRTIEEGRSLVKELRATIGQRDGTIRALRLMVLNDRTLLNKSE
jgi:hypothetical protein